MKQSVNMLGASLDILTMDSSYCTEDYGNAKFEIIPRVSAKITHFERNKLCQMKSVDMLDASLDILTIDPSYCTEDYGNALFEVRLGVPATNVLEHEEIVSDENWNVPIN